MGMYIDDYRPWPAWVVEGNEEIARKFGAQIGTYRGHADGDPGHDMSGDLAADFFLYDNTKTRHDIVLAWFKHNAVRIGATYVITWRRIWSVARSSEGVRTYTGSDPHTGHIHISYGTTPPKEEEDVAISPEDMEKLANLTAAKVAARLSEVWKSSEVDVLKAPAAFLGTGEVNPIQPGTLLERIADHVAKIEAKP